jgi:FimV-like protein
MQVAVEEPPAESSTPVSAEEPPVAQVAVEEPPVAAEPPAEPPVSTSAEEPPVAAESLLPVSSEKSPVLEEPPTEAPTPVPAEEPPVAEEPPAESPPPVSSEKSPVAAEPPAEPPTPVSAEEPPSVVEPPSPAKLPDTAATQTDKVYRGGDEYGPVSNNERLWDIATKVRPDPDIGRDIMMKALFLANPQAFAKPTMDHLKAGSVLRIPTLQEIVKYTDSTVAKSLLEQQRAAESRKADPGAAPVD